jgi:glycosyltransferase involved in cell wall biosynthesis
MEKSFSIVIPLYNHLPYIGATIESVRRQSYANYELIVVDDGSSDGGDLACERLIREVPNARMYRQPNHGAHHAINHGIGLASNELVSVLNSDDLFAEDKLARCNALFQSRPSLDLVFGDVGVIDDEGRDLARGETVDWLARAHAFLAKTGHLPLAIANENFAVTTSNMVFTKSLWERVNGFQNLRYCHDMDFLLSAMREGSCLYDQGSMHIKYRVHRNNTIKENLARVRLEIGSVLAASIAEGGLGLLGNVANAKEAAWVREFLDNKGLSGLLVALMGMYASSTGREDFYSALAEEEARQGLIRAFLQ